MSLKQTDYGILGVEIYITLDDEYDYFYCTDRDTNGRFWIRRSKEDIDEINIWDSERVVWYNRNVSASYLKANELLSIVEIVSEMKITLPTCAQAHGDLNKDRN